jgi:triosephosphate isomerase
MHLDHARTRRWLTEVAGAGLPTAELDVAVLPSFTAIPAAGEILYGSGVHYGAQNCCWEPAGPFTGEVSPAVLRELGCRYVEVGHAERRRLFGEDDTVIARKAAAVADYGMTPIICVGEPEPVSWERAGVFCAGQLDLALAALRGTGAEPIVAYEPVWAIGADRPAGPNHIQAVATGLRHHLDDAGFAHRARIIYGGAAGPGLIGQLPAVDGLFLGRSALQVDRFAATVAEAAALVRV